MINFSSSWSNTEGCGGVIAVSPVGLHGYRAEHLYRVTIAVDQMKINYLKGE
jgi:hypothetical protein